MDQPSPSPQSPAGRPGAAALASVLVPVIDDAGGRAVMEGAAAIAAGTGARLIGLAAGLPHRPRDTHAGLVVATFQPNEADRVGRFLQAGREAFTAIAAAHGVASEWRSAVNFPAWALCDTATLADLVVVGRAAPQLSAVYQAVSIGDLLMGAGRPVLVLPEKPPALPLATILIAWKGTRECRRMLVDCMPVLRAARRVEIVHVPEAYSDPSTLGDAQAYLGLHGVSATAVAVTSKSGIANMLIRHAESIGADAIAVGAYGHSRLREWCFGGVTRGLLHESPVPCIFSH